MPGWMPLTGLSRLPTSLGCISELHQLLRHLPYTHLPLRSLKVLMRKTIWKRVGMLCLQNVCHMSHMFVLFFWGVGRGCCAGKNYVGKITTMTACDSNEFCRRWMKSLAQARPAQAMSSYLKTETLTHCHTDVK